MTPRDTPSDPAGAPSPAPAPRGAGREPGSAPPTSAAGWIRRYAQAVGAPAPGDDEIDAVLAMAGVAAHASERTAAPLTAWLAGRAGIPVHEALAAAQGLADALGEGSGTRA